MYSQYWWSQHLNLMTAFSEYLVSLVCQTIVKHRLLEKMFLAKVMLTRNIWLRFVKLNCRVSSQWTRSHLTSLWALYCLQWRDWVSVHDKSIWNKLYVTKFVWQSLSEHPSVFFHIKKKKPYICGKSTSNNWTWVGRDER